jgi:hypothetical protein
LPVSAVSACVKDRCFLRLEIKIMIHRVEVEVTCDGKNCSEAERVEPEYLYRNYSETSGYYDTTPKGIQKKLKADYGWFIKDDKEYCCEECSE